MVDKITNSEGLSEYFTEGNINETSKENKSSSTFSNVEEGKDFYYFAAKSSNVEWGAGEGKSADAKAEVKVGTDHKEGETSFISRLENYYKNDLVWASHSHPGNGGAPSYNLRDSNNNLVGDLNSAEKQNLNTNYEVYCPNSGKVYTYTSKTLQDRFDVSAPDKALFDKMYNRK